MSVSSTSSIESIIQTPSPRRYSTSSSILGEDENDEDYTGDENEEGSEEESELDSLDNLQVIEFGNLIVRINENSQMEFQVLVSENLEGTIEEEVDSEEHKEDDDDDDDESESSSSNNELDNYDSFAEYQNEDEGDDDEALFLDELSNYMQ
jgi:hypothetical protein